MTEYGYVRVSTAEQNVGRQVAKMRGLGIPEGRLFVDHASGRDMERPRWKELMGVVREGDSIVVDSLDRLGRSYDDVTSEWRRLVGMGVDIRCLDLDFFDSAKLREMGAVGVCVEDMLLSLLAYVAQAEREKNRERQREGIELAKAAGKYRGRARAEFPAEKVDEAQRALREHGKRAAARVLGVHPATVYRMIEDGRLVS